MRKHIFKCNEIGFSIRVVVSFDRDTDFAESSGELRFCKLNIYILSNDIRFSASECNIIAYFNIYCINIAYCVNLINNNICHRC